MVILMALAANYMGFLTGFLFHGRMGCGREDFAILQPDEHLVVREEYQSEGKGYPIGSS